MARAGKSTTAAAPRLNPAQTWLGVPAGMPGRGCRAAIVGVPFDCGTHPTRIGARLGPSAIREQSHNLRRFDPRTNLDVVAALGLVDCGDVAVTPSDVEKSYAAIESAIEAVIADGAVAVTMGGDGAVSLPQIRAAARRHPGLCVVHLDAHTDAYPIQGYNTATSFRHVAQEGLIDTPSSFHIGVRGPTFVPGVFEFCRELGYNLITMPELRPRRFRRRRRARAQDTRRPAGLSVLRHGFLRPVGRARRLHADLGRLHVRRGPDHGRAVERAQCRDARRQHREPAA